MTDQRNLIFSYEKAIYDPTRMVILFNGFDNDKIVQCAVSYEALEDHFHETNKNSLEIFKIHRQLIEQQARRKYIEGNLEANGSILLRSEDFN